MKLFKDLVLTAPIRTKLSFGHNENLILEKVDFGERQNKGIKLKMHTFITLAKIDPEDENKVIARSEGNFFDLDHTSDFVWSNFMDEFTCLAALITAVGGDAEAFEDTVVQVFGENESEDFVKTKQGSKATQEALQDAFMDHIESKTGDNSPLLACKMISNKAGWLEFPKELGWIVPQEKVDKLPEVTSFDKKRYQEGLAKQTKSSSVPDKVGAPPAAGEKAPTQANALAAL